MDTNKIPKTSHRYKCTTQRVHACPIHFTCAGGTNEWHCELPPQWAQDGPAQGVPWWTVSGTHTATYTIHTLCWNCWCRGPWLNESLLLWLMTWYVLIYAESTTSLLTKELHQSDLWTSVLALPTAHPHPSMASFNCCASLLHNPYTVKLVPGGTSVHRLFHATVCRNFIYWAFTFH